MKLTDIKLSGYDGKLAETLDQDALHSAQVFKSSDMYDYAGKKLGYISRYPTYNPLRDNEDYFAQEQTGWEKGLNALKTFKSLSGNIFVNHFAGYGRQLNSASSGEWNKMWNDELGEESARRVKAQFNLNPIYETKEQQARRDGVKGIGGAFGQYVPFTGRAGNAWGNLLGQLGFTFGTIGAVAAESALLSLATPATGGASAAMGAIRAGDNARKVFRSIFSLFKGNKSLKNLKTTVDSASKLSKFVNSKPVEVYRMFTAASGEAAIEANMSALEYKEDQIQKYIDIHGEHPPLDFLNEIDDTAVKVGNTTFNWNLPVLMASNAITIGNMFKPSNLGKAAFVPKDISKEIIKKSKYIPSKGVMTTFLKGSPKLAKVVDKGAKVGKFVFKENLAEGFEEVAQGLGSRTAQHNLDLFNSDYNSGTKAFVSGLGKEISHSLKTGEIYDEFAAGFLTGFGIKGFTSVKNKIDGTTAKRNELIDKGVSKVDELYGRLIDPTINQKDANLILQMAASDSMQDSINDGDVKTAKDIKEDAEFEMLKTLYKFGVADEFYDMWGDSVKDMEASDPDGVKQMLQDRNINEVVTSLKQKQEKFNGLINEIQKNIANPYDSDKDKIKHSLFESAKFHVAKFRMQGDSAFERMEGLKSDIMAEYGLDEYIVESMLDPSMLNENRQKMKSLLDMQVQNIKEGNLSESEKELKEQEAEKTKQKLGVLDNIYNLSYDKDGNPKKKQPATEDMVSALLAGLYGETIAQQPAGLEKGLNDLLKLEGEGSEYLQIYNLLSKKEYFDKFGAAYVNKMSMGRQKYLESLKKESSNVSDTKDEDGEYSNDEYNDKVDNAEGSIGDIVGVVDNVEITEDGNIIIDGQTFNTTQDVMEYLSSQPYGSQLNVKSQGETFASIIKKRLNSLVKDVTDKKNVEENKEKHRGKTEQEVDTKYVGEPKTKSESNSERFGFVNNGKGTTLLHYFDFVLAKLWGKTGLSKVTEALHKINDDETVDKLKKAKVDLGGNVRLTILSLADLDTLNKSISEINKSDDIRVIHDGIRFYFLVKDGLSSADVIERETGLRIEPSPNTVIATINGVPVVSPFRENLFDDSTDIAVHSLNVGDKVELIITDNEYNNTLKQELDNGDITETEYYERLHVSAVIDVLGEQKTVGVLRAADFLFEKENKRGELEEFREALKNNNIGDSIGFTAVKGTTTARFKGEYVGIESWNNSDYKQTFYYVTEDNDVIDSNGKVLTPVEIRKTFDRGNFRRGGVYMKIEDGDGRNHTVQLYSAVRETPSYTKEEFLEWDNIKGELQTNLSQDTPITSKRLIVDITDIGDSSENKIDELESEIEDETVVEDEVTVTDANDNSTTMDKEGALDNIEDIKEVLTMPEETDFITQIMETLVSHGISANALFVKLFAFRNLQVEKGNEISTLQEFLESAVNEGVITQDAMDDFNYVVSPIFRNIFWKWFNNSESIWDVDSNVEWQNFKSDIISDLSALSNIMVGNTPPEKVQEFIEKHESRLKGKFKKFKISNWDLSNLNFDDVKDIARILIEAISIDNVKKGIYNANIKLAKFGIQVYSDTLSKINEVDKKSLFRNPLNDKDLGNIFSDLRMSNVDDKVYVRNEKDGFFVEVSPPRKKASKEILNLQKYFVSLLNVKPTIAYLQSYEKLNGNLDGLKERIATQVNKHKFVNEWGRVDITDNDIVKKEKDIIETTFNKDGVTYKKDNYVYFTTNGKNSIYVKEGKAVNTKELDKIIKGKSKSTLLKKQSKLMERISRVKSLQETISNLNCK